MRALHLQRATPAEVRHACLRFHYARAVPIVAAGFSAYQDGEWCGVVLYGRGAIHNIAKPFGMVQGEVIELVRVALNGRQRATSQVVATSLRLLRRDAPLVRVVVSYADTEQGHVGTIYQATNWYCIDHGERAAPWLRIHGEVVHPRSVVAKYGTSALAELRKIDPKAERVPKPAKIKYAFPLDPAARGLLQEMALEYKRRQQSGDAPGAHPGEGGSTPTTPL